MKTQVIRKTGKLWCIGPNIPVRIQTETEAAGKFDITDYDGDEQKFYERIHPGTEIRYTTKDGVLVDIVRVTPDGKELPINGTHFITEKSTLARQFFYIPPANQSSKVHRELRVPLLNFTALGFKKRR